MRGATAWGIVGGTAGLGGVRNQFQGPAVTQGYLAANAAIMPTGTAGTGSYLAHNFRSVSAVWNPRVSFRVYARKLTLQYIPLGGALTCRIDGVGQTLAQNAAWQTTVVMNNASDAWHDVELLTQVSGDTLYLEADSFISIDSANPQISYPTGFSSTLYNAGGLTYVKVDGSLTFNAGAGNSYASANGLSGWTRFKATTSVIKLYCYQSSGYVSLYQDGVLLGRTPCTGSGYFEWITLPASDGTTEHEYWLAMDQSTASDGTIANANNAGYFTKVSANGMNTGALTSRDLLVFAGDSITQGVGLVSSYYDQSWAMLTAVGKSYAPRNHGQSGQTLVGAVAGGIVTTVNNTSPVRVVVNYGRNDVQTGVTDANFRNAVYDILHGLCGGSATKIYYPGILPGTVNGATRTTFNGYIAAIIGGAADASARSLTAPEQAKCVYLNTDSWIDTGTDLNGQYHLLASGNAKVATQLIAAIT